MHTTEVTYNKINFFDLVQMFREHLGVVVRGDKGNDGSYNWDTYDFEPADDMYPFGQNTFVIVDPDEFTDSLEWFYENYGKNNFDTYVKQLFDRDLLPKTHPLFVEICW